VAILKCDTSEVLAMLVLLPSELRDRAMATAINKTADKAKAEMKRQIVAVYNVKSTEVGGALNVVGAKLKDSTTIQARLYPSSISGAKRAMNVVHFLQGTSRGDLVFLFKKSGGSKLIGPGGSGESKPFIGNKGRTVFRRQGRGRLPIESVQVIDVPQMFNAKALNNAVLAKASADLLVEAERAIAFSLSGLK